MRIAVVSHVRHPIAPPFMGGMEAHSWHLVHGLAGRGHDVTLFASGDSAAPALVHPIVETHYNRTFPWHAFHGTDALNRHLDASYAAVARVLLDGGFDVVHNNSLHRYPPRLARTRCLPTVTSLHVPPFDALRRAVHESAAPWSRFTVTSAAQLRLWWPTGAPDEAAIVSNGIDLSLWPFSAKGCGGAVWAGRITPNKGAHLAVEAARIADVPLTIFGTIEDDAYFDAAIRPRLSSSVRYGGHLGGSELAQAFGAASVLLFTPLWEEPFGLAAIEAMACGVPVAATKRGAVREVIGEAGVVAPTETPESLATALTAALSIPRIVPRRRVERLFSIDHMLDRYEAQYLEAIAGLDQERPAITFPAIELTVAERQAVVVGG